MKNKVINHMLHGIDCQKTLQVSGIYANDDGHLYLEIDGGVEVSLEKILKPFEENTITLCVSAKEEGVV